MSDERDKQMVEIVSEALSRLESIGLAPLEAAHALIAGGLHTISAGCCNQHLPDELDAVATQVEHFRHGYTEHTEH